MTIFIDASAMVAMIAGAEDAAKLATLVDAHAEKDVIRPV